MMGHVSLTEKKVEENFRVVVKVSGQTKGRFPKDF